MRLIICYLYLFLFSISYCLGQGSFGKITSQPADFIRYGLTPVSYFQERLMWKFLFTRYKIRISLCRYLLAILQTV